MPLSETKLYRRWCCAMLLLLSAACSQQAEYLPLEGGATVLALGDSITYGTGALPGQDYPSRLSAELSWHIVNAGVPGDTSAQAKDRLGGLIDRHKPDLIIVELGGNDFLGRRPEPAVKEDLRVIVRQAIESGAQVLLVSVPRLSLARAGFGRLKDSDIYAELAHEESVPLFPGSLSGILSDSELRADPIHPNARGYAVLASEMANFLRDIGIADTQGQ